MKLKLFAILYLCFIACFFHTVNLAVASPLEPHLLSPEAYSENYIAVFELENGAHMQIQLALTNIGVGDQHSMCRVLYIDQDNTWNEQKVFNKEQWDFSPPGNLTFGSCQIMAEDQSTSLVAQVNGIKVETSFAQPLNPSQGPGHRIDTGDGFFDLDILLPWAPVKLNVDVPEHPARAIKGNGCIYHFWVTAWPGDLARKWVRIFGLWENGAFLVMSHFPPDGGPGMGAIWLPGGDEPVALESIELKSGESDVLLFKTMKGQAFQFDIQQQLFRHAPLEDLGFLGRIIRLFMGNWVTRTYRANIKLLDHEGVQPAIVEITVDE